MKNTPIITIEDIKALEEKRESAKITMARKAKIYDLIIRISSMSSYISSTITIILVCLATDHLSLKPTVYIFGTIMVISILTQTTSFITKKVWEHKLRKLGLSPALGT